MEKITVAESEHTFILEAQCRNPCPERLESYPLVPEGIGRSDSHNQLSRVKMVGET
jgi:hypothetical protein